MVLSGSFTRLRNTSPFGGIVKDWTSIKNKYSETLVVMCVVMAKGCFVVIATTNSEYVDCLRYQKMRGIAAQTRAEAN